MVWSVSKLYRELALDMLGRALGKGNASICAGLFALPELIRGKEKVKRLHTNVTRNLKDDISNETTETGSVYASDSIGRGQTY